ncbi:hypothetical protein EXIGLDRAFT_764996 [Exidia glandulosa HHB12029]|uniref:BTB domain-containing protein n=1 Tax=Exidia glandulosa HHB12029 TaxID=1314781 RepID=A0A165KRJ2_EXIGL|nr:hypothetical protein EXIGLDRAFT_764996 [Exidia glandulosa HHB12029]
MTNAPVEVDYAGGSTDAIVLVAQNGDRYRVPRAALHHGSSFFQSMLSLPQPVSASTSSEPDPITMSEDSDILHYLVTHMCGRPLPPVTSLAQADKILLAADKFDMPNLTSVIHYLLQHPPEPTHHIHRHVLAARYRWADMCKAEAMASLNASLDSAEAARCDPAFVVPLLNLRQQRTDAFAGLVNAMRTRVTLPFAMFTIKPVLSSRSADDRDVAAYNHESGSVFFWRMRYEFSLRPGGAFVVQEEYVNWPEWTRFEANGLTDQPCVERLKERLRKIVDSLPADLPSLS